MNIIKAIRFHWMLRKVPGGWRKGRAEDVIDSMIRAGIIKEVERREATDGLKLWRVSNGFEKLADSIYEDHRKWK
jgi:hypothetical protein